MKEFGKHPDTEVKSNFLFNMPAMISILGPKSFETF